MNQLLLLIVSYIYGFITGYIYTLINKLKIRQRYFYLIMLIYFIIITLIYLIIYIYINRGEIHLYLKFVLILGFLTSTKLSNSRKGAKLINKK